MHRQSKAERYRRLALKETNKGLIGLFYRLADEAERRERAVAQSGVAGSATVISLQLWRARRSASVTGFGRRIDAA